MTNHDTPQAWAFLVEGRSEQVRPLFLLAVRAAEYESHLPDDALSFIDGERGWCAVVCKYLDNPLVAEPPEEIADLLRTDGGRQVILLNFVKNPDWYVYPYASHWDGRGWRRDEDCDPRERAAQMGVIVPGPRWPSRPRREAALVEGADPALVDRVTRLSAQKISTARGIVLLGEDLPSYALSTIASSVYKVVHFLDADEFRFVVWQRTRGLQEFTVGAHTPVLAPPENVDGETDPRAIVRKLGIPEDYVFPPTDERD